MPTDPHAGAPPRGAVHLAVLGVVLAATALAATRLGGGASPSVAPGGVAVVATSPNADAASSAPGFQALVPRPSPAQAEQDAPVAAPIAPLRTHRVQPGETLAGIAARYGLRVETLLWANDLEDPSLVRPEQELRVPAVDGVMYALEPGDTLRGVAERAGIPLADILAVNPLGDADRVAAGTELLLPGAAPAAVAGGIQAAASVGTPTPPKPAPVTYEVQTGDTLASLGAKFGVDVATLLAANDITDPNTIRVGTTLRVLPVSGVEYVVQPGERLAEIAARYRTVLGLIIDFNDITDPDLVRAGDRLVIPGGQRPALAPPRPLAEAAAKAPPAPPAASVPAPKPEAAKPAVAPAPVQPAPPAAKPAPAAPPAPLGGALGQRIVAEALKYNGYRYTWGGSSPSTGFDCSGLVWYVHQQAGASISRGLWGQYNAGAKVARGDLQAGDIVFFQNTYMPGLSHNGIYIGNGQFINAVDESTGVVISRLDNPYWVERWFGATRVGG